MRDPGDGSIHEAPNVSILRYAGGGQWSYQEDMYNVDDFVSGVKQGKANLDSWWIIFPTFAVLVITLLLLTFIGDALRDAFDTRKS